MLRRILTGQTHDTQGPCAQPCGHGVPQLADHAGAGAGVHDDDGRWPARTAHPGGFLLIADDLSEPVHRLKHLRPDRHRDLAVGGGGHQLAQRHRGTQPIQPAHRQPGRSLTVDSDAALEMAQAQPIHPGGPLAARPQLDPCAPQRRSGGTDLLLVGGVRQVQAPAQVAGSAAPSRLKPGVIEHRPEEGHPAGG